MSKPLECLALAYQYAQQLEELIEREHTENINVGSDISVSENSYNASLRIDSTNKRIEPLVVLSVAGYEVEVDGGRVIIGREVLIE